MPEQGTFIGEALKSLKRLIHLPDELSDNAGRMRTSNPYSKGMHKFLYNTNSSRWFSKIEGAATITYDGDESAVDLNLTTANGDRAVYQSMYYDYQPGIPQQIKFTYLPDGLDENREFYLGYGDDLNGIFLVIKGTKFYTMVRKNGIDGDLVAEEDFLRKIRLNVQGQQLIYLDFQWFGIGKIRWGAVVNGDLRYFNQEVHDQETTGTYMGTPNLPIRVEVKNIGTCDAVGGLQLMCAAIESEGGTRATGFEFAPSNETLPVVIGAVNYSPILAIRLTNTFNSKPNRKKAEITHLDFYVETNDIHYKLMHHRDWTSLEEALGAIVWTSVDDLSSIEYAVGGNVAGKLQGTLDGGTPTVAGGHQHKHRGGYSSTGVANKGQEKQEELDVFSEHSFLMQNYDADQSELFILYAKSMSGAAGVGADMAVFETD